MKIYQSEKWLRKKYVVEEKSEEEIAALCGVTQVTINRYLRKFKLKRA